MFPLVQLVRIIIIRGEDIPREETGYYCGWNFICGVYAICAYAVLEII